MDWILEEALGPSLVSSDIGPLLGDMDFVFGEMLEPSLVTSDIGTLVGVCQLRGALPLVIRLLDGRAWSHSMTTLSFLLLVRHVRSVGSLPGRRVPGIGVLALALGMTLGFWSLVCHVRSVGSLPGRGVPGIGVRTLALWILVVAQAWMCLGMV